MKRIASLLLLICLTSVCLAQPNDSIRSKVREIKLSEEYVYAESGSMTDFSEAQSAASEKLYAAAITLMSEHLKQKEEMKSIWTKAEPRKLFMEYRNGTLFKVFTYIPKSCLVEMPSKAETATNVTVPPQQSKVAVVPIAKTSLAGQPSATEADSIIQIVAQQVGQDAVTQRNTNTPTEKSYNVDENTAALVTKMLPFADSQHTSAAKQNATAVVAPSTSMTENTHRVLKDLLAMETYESAMMYLNAMKDDGRLMFGSLKKAMKIERSYLLIIKDGKVETILGKGTNERINLKSLEEESIHKYIGYGIVWIQVFDKN